MSKISIRGPVCTTSYGLVVLNVIKSLTELGHEVSCFPIGLDGNDIPEQFYDSLRRSLENAKFWDVDSPSITIYHQFALAESAGRKRIGWPIFELDSFNDLELHHLKSLDHIILCSQWAKDVCLKNGLGGPLSNQKISVVPLGVDLDLFSRDNSTERFISYPDYKNSASFTLSYIKQVIDSKTTVFISVAKKELRKFHDGLIRCFERAFTIDDNVELWMVWGNRILNQIRPEESKQWNDYYNKSRLKSKIRLFEWLPNQKDVINIMNKADCFVGVSRAEGWNLPLLEAMAMGLQVITNDYSGHSEFIDKSNPYLIPFREKEIASDGLWFNGQGNWMAIDNPEESLIIEYMKDIHFRKQKQINLYSDSAVKQASKFTWKRTAENLIEAVL